MEIHKTECVRAIVPILQYFRTLNVVFVFMHNSQYFIGYILLPVGGIGEAVLPIMLVIATPVGIVV
jgi:hypothetical protein